MAIMMTQEDVNAASHAILAALKDAPELYGEMAATFVPHLARRVAAEIASARARRPRHPEEARMAGRLELAGHVGGMAVNGALKAARRAGDHGAEAMLLDVLSRLPPTTQSDDTAPHGDPR